MRGDPGSKTAQPLSTARLRGGRSMRAFVKRSVAGRARRMPTKRDDSMLRNLSARFNCELRTQRVELFAQLERLGRALADQSRPAAAQQRVDLAVR